MRLGECGLTMSGESQFQRSPGPFAASSGWMPIASPVARLKRDSTPNCACAYTVFGSEGSNALPKPSPPCVMIQSALRMPLTERVRLGPTIEKLSCVPPATR